MAGLPLIGVNAYSFGNFGCDYNWLDRSRGGLFYNYFRGFQGKINILHVTRFLVQIRSCRSKYWALLWHLRLNKKICSPISVPVL